MVKRNYQSDFPVQVSFKNGAGLPTTPPSCPWEIHFTDTAGTCFRCSYDGTSYESCEIVDDKVVCYIDNPGFIPGRLLMTVIINKPDARYDDGIETQVAVYADEVYLVDGIGTNIVDVSAIIPIVTLVIKGEYNATTTYSVLDVVFYDGSSWVCTATSVGHTPADGSPYWQLLVSGEMPHLGYFSSYQVLEQRYPNPEVGQWAVVADGNGTVIYRCDVDGEWTNTGQSGDVFDLNVEEWDELIKILRQIPDDGLYYTDADGYVAMQYTPSYGLDAAAVSEHLKELIAPGLHYIKTDGLYYADASGNIALKYDTDGLDVAAVSNHFKSLIGGEDGYEVLTDDVYTI